LQLAEIIKFAKMATNVGQGATCASACFLIFAGGETKFANYTAQIGVHGVFPSCQPENATCNTGISLKGADGLDIIVKITKDAKDKVVSRETCTFNATSDIRVCLDWDKGTTRRDMKNVQGVWYKVSDD
jgi:hypothetical protein